MNDFMVDLETLGTGMNSATLEIAVVQCDLITGKLGSQFIRSVDVNASQRDGFDIDGNTFYWWLQQPQFARNTISDGSKIEIAEALKDLNEYWDHLGNPKNFRLWGNGPSFDNAMIRHAYLKLDMECAIPFWQDRCVRTVVGFSPKQILQNFKQTNLRPGAHNALADCKYQIKYCSYILQMLGCEELY